MEGMPMHFCFYPRHEYACAHVGHCPHLGGVALGSVVDAANESGDYWEMLHGQLDSMQGQEHFSHSWKNPLGKWVRRL